MALAFERTEEWPQDLDEKAAVDMRESGQNWFRGIPQSVSAVIKNVARQTGIPSAVIIGKSQQPHIVAARRLAANCLRRAGYSFPQIGVWLGGRSHSTIIHLCAPRKPQKRKVRVESGEIPVPDYSGEWAI